jgi:tight adherence protein B
VFVLFIAVFTVVLVIFLLVTRVSKKEKATLSRVERITAVGGAVRKDPLLVEAQHMDKYSTFGKHIDLLIQQGAVSLDRTTVYGLSAGGAVAAALFSLIMIPTLAFECLGAVIGGAAPYLYLRIMRARRLAAFNKELPESIDLISRAVKSGHSVQVAFEIAAGDARQPVKAELGVLVGQLSFGLPQEEALMKMSERVPSQDLRFLVTAILIQKQTGGNLPQILERTTHMIRERSRINGELRVKTAQGRLSALVLVLLPIGLTIALKIIDPHWLDPLFTEQYGHYMLYYALASLSIGMLSVYMITRPEV